MVDSTSRPLSAVEAEALHAIRHYMREQGFAPSLENLALRVGKGKTTVLATVRRLERKGYVTRPTRRVARGLQLTDLGRVA